MQTYAKELSSYGDTSKPEVVGFEDLNLTTDKSIRVTLRTVEYAAQAVNDTIVIDTLREGERLISITAVTNVSLGSTTLDIGTKADADRFASGATLATNVRKDVMQGLFIDNYGGATEDIIVTVKAAAMPSATTNPVGALQFMLVVSGRV